MPRCYRVDQCTTHTNHACTHHARLYQIRKSASCNSSTPTAVARVLEQERGKAACATTSSAGGATAGGATAGGGVADQLENENADFATCFANARGFR